MSQSQVDWDLYFLRIVDVIASKSRCKKRTVGCVITDINRRIISSGYNFKPMNTDCDDEPCRRLNITTGKNQDSVACCSHAELSAVTFADYNSMKDGIIYISCAPCPICSLVILNTGVKRLVYWEDLDPNHQDGIKLIKDYTKNSHRLEITTYKRDSRPTKDI